MTNSPAIALKDVHLTLGEGAGRVHILKGIDLQIEKGASVGLVGPSGSGKSTLLMVMAGLERADEGSVNVAGSELGPLSEDQLARFRGRNVGIIFQSFHLVPNMTALEKRGRTAGTCWGYRRIRQGQGGAGLPSGSVTACTTTRRNCPAANSSVSPWQGRWSSNPRS